MSVVRLTLAYDGSGFRGWARQRGQRTVQGELEDVLEHLIGTRVTLAVAGRTDAGVHARSQVASFVLDDDIDPAALQRHLNDRLAPEVVISDARRAPDAFHARFSATAREYRYRIDDGAWPGAPLVSDVWRRPGRLDVRRMRAAGRHLVGEHDFASFCRRPQSGGTVRRLDRLTVGRRGDLVVVTARANAFLHQMVRALVGTLVAVGSGRIGSEQVPALLSARERAGSPQMAPARGLTLERVVYGRTDARRFDPERPGRGAS